MAKPVADSLPWAEILTVAFGVLRYAPQDFWQMTPHELLAALRPLRPFGLASACFPARAEVERLLREFPD